FDSYVEPIYFNSKHGSEAYRRTLCFMLAAAAHKLHPERRLTIGHSLGYAYYYTFESDTAVKEEEIAALEAEMRASIAADTPIATRIISYTQAKALLEKNGQTETRKHLDYVNPDHLLVNTMGDYCDMNIGPLVNRTGKIRTFALLPYQDGFLLQFPTTKNPDELPAFTDHPKIFQIYRTYKAWGKQINVT
ncbi:MAG: nucleoside kinase, partial [Treponemataceae bacterium]|nr:nucleoside kinase [Treponemataceae bacterium]